MQVILCFCNQISDIRIIKGRKTYSGSWFSRSMVAWFYGVGQNTMEGRIEDGAASRNKKRPVIDFLKLVLPPTVSRASKTKSLNGHFMLTTPNFPIPFVTVPTKTTSWRTSHQHTIL